MRVARKKEQTISSMAEGSLRAFKMQASNYSRKPKRAEQVSERDSNSLSLQEGDLERKHASDDMLHLPPSLQTATTRRETEATPVSKFGCCVSELARIDQVTRQDNYDYVRLSSHSATNIHAGFICTRAHIDCIPFEDKNKTSYVQTDEK